MSEPLHIQLLKEMAQNRTGWSFNVLPFIYDHFTHEKHDDRYENKGAVLFFLEDLTYRGFVDGDEVDGVWQPDTVDSKQVMTYSKDSLFFKLTSKGLDYLDEYNKSKISYDLNKSYSEVNKASLRNYKIQLALSIITLILALTSAVIGVLSYYKVDETARSVDRLREELHLLKSSR